MAIVYHHEGTAIGIEIPDMPGVLAAADNWEDLETNVQEAVELWAEGQDFEPPAPSDFTTIRALPQVQDGTLMIVNIDFDFLKKESAQCAKDAEKEQKREWLVCKM